MDAAKRIRDGVDRRQRSFFPPRDLADVFQSVAALMVIITVFSAGRTWISLLLLWTLPIITAVLSGAFALAAAFACRVMGPAAIIKHGADAKDRKR